MMRSLRENTKFIMIIVALAFVGLMVFEWGMDMSGRSAPTATGDVGSVNGTPISYRAWTQTYRNLSNQYREQKGSALNDLELDLVEQQAWNQLVNQILIQQELERRGIRVTDEEIRLAFKTSPPPWLRESEIFQTEGEFDYEKYRRFFSGPATDPALLQQMEAYYRDVLPRTRLLEQVSMGIYVSDSELWDLYRERTERVRAEYLVVDPEAVVPDEAISVSEEELRSYYRAHAEEFERPQTAEVELVTLERAPGPADSAAALERARELRSRIAEGADFAELAREHSADPGSAASGGDLGWIGRDEVSPAFERAAFALRPGDVSDPVLTPLGYHIVKVTERREDRVRASHILIRITLGGQGEDELLGRVDRLEELALTEGLDVGADSVGVPVRRVTLSRGNDFVPGIGQFGPVQDWAFHDSTQIGELSRVYEAENAFHVFELIDREPAGRIPYAEAEPSVRRRVVLEEKKEKSRGLAEEIAGELHGGASLAATAREHGLDVNRTDFFTRLDFVPDLGQANAVIGTAFGLAVGEVGGPVEADDRFYFIKTVDRVEPDRRAFERQRNALRARLASQRREQALSEWLDELRENAEIIDRRGEIFVPRS